MMAAHKTTESIELKALLGGLIPSEDSNDTDISSIELDSRRVKPGSLFFGINGATTDGRKYVNDAIKNGAAAIVLESTSNASYREEAVPFYEVTDIKSVMGIVASRFYGNPSGKLQITGVTGTNGKTSVAYFLNQALSRLTNKPVGIIGTLGTGTGDKLVPSPNTTPDVITLNTILDDFSHQGIEQVVMEVSSHGLDQGRVANIEFFTTVFTNLSQDHLDYHRSMDAYGDAKRKLFFLPSVQNAVINIGDDFGQKISSELPNNINQIRYSLIEADTEFDPEKMELAAKIYDRDIYSISMEIYSIYGNGQLTVNLVGDYNAGNILACLGVLCVIDYPLDAAIEALAQVKAVPGRMELFCAPTSPKIFIDYSHTPDALEKALQTLRKLGSGRLICVFGCGGNRDREKRPVMGKIAEQYCDMVVLTNDNPRNEPGENIILDIKSGMTGKISCEVELDRVLAIRKAIGDQGPDDFVLIAGKGHETYQETNGKKVPFSDRQLVITLLEAHW
jgi:UDP-N-acetylmuramoyl-L-alanyl-D-glutamate--2,6-diaminopimelate ligase